MEKKYFMKDDKPWTIEKLAKSKELIEFPEFQRESVWRLDKKQKLIDSIFRGFDISSIYLFQRDDGQYDCIDGEQRINAIWSYLGTNDGDQDNEFHSKIVNEIYDDKRRFDTVDQKRFKNLNEKTQKKFLDHEVNIVFITKIDEDDELNLQFIRLQIGVPLNAGEKLNAMQGDMRNLIFNKEDNDFIDRDFFNKSGFRKGRFGRQEIAAQILLNIFSKKETNEFHKSRYVDLQEFFKKKVKLLSSDRKIIEETKHTMKIIEKYFKTNLEHINNKGIAVSVFLFVNELLELKKEKEINDFVEFFLKFLKTRSWQVAKGIDIDRAYRNILNFQTNLTQAAGEKTAIQNRHEFLGDYFDYYKKTGGIIKGDEEYNKTGNADKERDKVKI
ncbi:MAG: DUF262 domain-containing protein [Ignavibacteriaceae bacterium]|jgi:hypothetical protein